MNKPINSNPIDNMAFLIMPEIMQRESLKIKSEIVKGLKKFKIKTTEEKLSDHIPRISLVKLKDDVREFCLDFEETGLSDRKTICRFKTNWVYE